jgi:conjugal transfer mating pair stabilization protein TraN
VIAMRRLIIWITLLSFVTTQSAAIAGPFEEGTAAGQAANPVIRGTVNAPSASSAVPEYTTTPPETAYYGQPNLSGAANVRLSTCAASANDPVCQAQDGALSSANTPRPAISAYDPAVTAARDIASNPSSALGSLADYYSGCTTAEVSSAVGTTTKVCNRYSGVGNYTTRRDLTVEIDLQPSCVEGTWVAHGQVNRNGADTMVAEAQCQLRNDGLQRFRFYAAGGKGACIGWQTVDLPTAPASQATYVTNLAPHWEGHCWSPFTVTMMPGSGCTSGTCNYTFQFGSTWSLPLSFVQPAMVQHETDVWVDNSAVLNAGGRCTITTADTCVDGPATKAIEGRPVTRACWSYERTLTCTSGAPIDECAALASNGCTPASSTCKQLNVGSGLCEIAQDTYTCPVAARTTTTASNCPANVYCLGTNCFNTSYTNDADFARSMSLMEAGREAGVYLDTSKMQVFKGEGNRCRHRLLKNCCSSDSAGAGMTNQSLFGTGSSWSTTC